MGAQTLCIINGEIKNVKVGPRRMTFSMRRTHGVIVESVAEFERRVIEAVTIAQRARAQFSLACSRADHGTAPSPGPVFAGCRCRCRWSGRRRLLDCAAKRRAGLPLRYRAEPVCAVRRRAVPCNAVQCMLCRAAPC